MFENFLIECTEESILNTKAPSIYENFKILSRYVYGVHGKLFAEKYRRGKINGTIPLIIIFLKNT